MFKTFSISKINLHIIEAVCLLILPINIQLKKDPVDFFV